MAKWCSLRSSADWAAAAGGLHKGPAARFLSGNHFVRFAEGNSGFPNILAVTVSGRLSATGVRVWLLLGHAAATVYGR